MPTYELKIRLNGSVSYVTVQASDSHRARQFVEAQYAGRQITVLQTRRVS